MGLTCYKVTKLDYFNKSMIKVCVYSSTKLSKFLTLSLSSPKDGNKVTSTSSNHLVCDKQKKATLFHEHCHSHTDRRSAHTLSLDRLYAAAAEQTVVGNPNSAAAGPEYFSM